MPMLFDYIIFLVALAVMALLNTPITATLAAALLLIILFRIAKGERIP